MGRVMRPYDGKEFGLWLDHSGNYLRFRDDWDEVYEDGVRTLDNKAEKAKKEPTEREKKESKCPSCSALWSRYSDTCTVCGYVRKRRNDVSTIAGEMVELNSSSKAHKEDKQTFYSELMYIAKDKNYNIHWASHKYREKFGVWPKGLHEGTLFPSQKTLGWIKHKNIAWAKKQNKGAV
jgi:superfamily II DNA or RNA helicase